MTCVLVDSNVLLDVITEDPEWARWSAEQIERVAEESVLCINPIVYAEVSIGFERVEDLEAALPPESFRRDSLPWGAAFLAGKCFLAYRRRGHGRKKIRHSLAILNLFKGVLKWLNI